MARQSLIGGRRRNPDTVACQLIDLVIDPDS
jgi:hypothetical protein